MIIYQTIANTVKRNQYRLTIAMILAVDVGKGTEDIMIHDSGNFENAIQMVVPSTAQIYKKLLEKEKADRIYFRGSTIAGEPWNTVIYELASERQVIMTDTAARSLRYNLDQVRGRNITVVKDQELASLIKCDDVVNLRVALSDEDALYNLTDINWTRIRSILTDNLIQPNDIVRVLVCCQDHGEPPIGQSVRDFRIKELYSKLNVTGNLEDLLRSVSTPDTKFPRHVAIGNSVIQFFKHMESSCVFVMDSSPAVLLGALSELNDKGTKLIINVGNGHVVVAYVNGKRTELVFEGHKGGVKQVEQNIRRILKGELSHQQILESGGHGLYRHGSFTPLSDDEIKMLLEDQSYVIGPNRDLLEFRAKRLHPGGAMMMAGPIGLIRAMKFRDQ